MNDSKTLKAFLDKMLIIKGEKKKTLKASRIKKFVKNE